MSIRTLSQLHEDQRELMSDYRRQRDGDQAARTPQELPPIVTVGKITGLVLFDPNLGSHMLISPLVYRGTPPIWEFADKPEVRA